MFRKKGFTLLELIIVIIVIGILASIALPRYMRVAERARVAEAKSMLSAIRSSQFRYEAQYQNFTNDIADLDMVPSNVKYFTYVSVDGLTTIGGVDNAIGGATRTDTERGGLDEYVIGIDENGVMNISNSEYNYLL